MPTSIGAHAARPLPPGAIAGGLPGQQVSPSDEIVHGVSSEATHSAAEGNLSTRF
jgi:hypothetical protein